MEVEQQEEQSLPSLSTKKQLPHIYTITALLVNSIILTIILGNVPCGVGVRDKIALRNCSPKLLAPHRSRSKVSDEKGQGRKVACVQFIWLSYWEINPIPHASHQTRIQLKARSRFHSSWYHASWTVICHRCRSATLWLALQWRAKRMTQWLIVNITVSPTIVPGRSRPLTSVDQICRVEVST